MNVNPNVSTTLPNVQDKTIEKPGNKTAYDFNSDKLAPSERENLDGSVKALASFYDPDGNGGMPLQKVARPKHFFQNIKLGEKIIDEGKNSGTITTNEGVNEKIFARDGNDTIKVNNGHKQIRGGGGDDTIQLMGPGTGNHAIYGGRGNDTVMMDNDLVEDGGPMQVYAEMRRDRDGNVIKNSNGEPEYAFLVNCVDGYFDYMQGVETIKFANGKEFSAKELYEMAMKPGNQHGSFQDWVEPDKSSAERGTTKGGGIENLLTPRNN